MNPEQNNPLQPNPERMVAILSEKIARTETENAVLKTQVEQLVTYINEIQKKEAEKAEQNVEVAKED